MEIVAIFVSILGPVIVGFLRDRFSRPRCGIQWVVLPPKSMMEIADEISDRLKTTFDEQPVKNLTKFSFILHNSGREPLDHDSIVEPLKWIGPGTIFDTRVVATVPAVELKIKHSDSNMEISWQLFNQSCQAFIEVICESESESDGDNITGQIKQVPEVKVKYINPFDEEKIRERVRKNYSRARKNSRYLKMWENMSVYGARYIRLFFLLYFTFILWPISFAICDSILEFSTAVSELISTLFSVSVIFSIMYLTRNPYSKLLQSRSKHNS